MGLGNMEVRTSPWTGTVIPLLRVLCRLEHRHLGFPTIVTVALGVLEMLAGISISGERVKKDIERKTDQTGERTCASHNG